MRMVVAAVMVCCLWPASAALADAPLHLVQEEEEVDEPPTPPWDDDANPFTQFIKAPMALPWFWNASLDGWAPWGRSNGVKNTCSFLTMWLGSCMILVFPFAFALSVVMTVMAVLLAAFAIYSFVMTGFRNGCIPKSSTVRSGTLAANSIFDVWTWAMCCSYTVCTPWFGFKLIQRGWLAFRDPIPEKVRAKKRGKGSAPRPEPDDPVVEQPDDDASPVTPMAATPGTAPPLRY